MRWQSSKVRLLALAGVLMVLTAVAHGQQGVPALRGPARKAGPSLNEDSRPSGLELVVIPLKYTPAPDVQAQLNSLFSQQGLRSIPVRDHAIAVSALPATLKQVREYIAAIDNRPEAEEAAGPSVKQRFQVVNLKGSGLDNDLPHVLQLLGNVQAAVDRQREAVVLSGPEKDVQEAVKLLRQLEDLHAAQPAENPPPHNFRVRVVWLANYPAVKDLPRERNLPVPADLKEVQAELAGMGIGDLRLVSQSLASTNSGNFEVEGVPPGMPGGPGNARILVKGTILEPVDERLGVELTLDVSDPGEPQSKLCRLSTRITTTSGHLVVLGVTPAMQSTSVFVVQIVAK